MTCYRNALSNKKFCPAPGRVNERYVHNHLFHSRRRTEALGTKPHPRFCAERPALVSIPPRPTARGSLEHPPAHQTVEDPRNSFADPEIQG